MKITDPDVIKSGEKDLIDAVKEDLDLDAVKDIIKNRLTARSLSSKGGQIVVHDNQVAFRLDFDVHLSGSLLFDREGNHIRSSEDIDSEDSMDQDPDSETENKIDESDAMDGSLESMDLDDPGDEMDPLSENEDSDDPAPVDEDEEELQIDLPDYGLEDEPGDDGQSPALEESDPLTQETEDGADQDPEENSLENMDLEDEELLQEEVLDEDINDILKESRDFWDQKKES
ncbi:hypothetical protein [Desulfospira joergensenii]|uniref:hypothetical protein n=1 Tax=Desulfospira joergensenii TaxID=53329 RepID=UPI0003B5B438|nr:hypothetical protein [Desulfospira joergensenii]